MMRYWSYRLMLLVAVFLTGCHSQEEQGFSDDGRKRIRFNLLLISASQVEHFRWVEEAYERLNPDIDVVFEQFPGNSLKDYEIKLRLQFTSGTAPDIFFVNDRVVSEFARFGLVSEAPDFIRAYADSMSLNEAIREAPYFGGKSYGLTSDIASTVLYYNRQLFKEAGLDPDAPPTTWAELLQYAERLTAYDENGNLERVGLSLRKTGYKPGTAEKWLTFLFSAGGDAFDEAGTRALFNSKAGREATELYNHVLFDKKLDSVEFDGDQQGFGQGRVAMFVREVHVIRWLQEYYPDLDFATAPIPALQESVSGGGTYLWAVSGESPHQQEAWKFIQYMMSHEVYARYAAIGGVIPTIRSVAELPQYKNDPYLSVFLNQKVRSVKPFPRMPQALEMLGAYIERFCYGHLTVEEFLERSEQDLNGLLATNR